MSAALSIKGINQFPNPLIKIGITIKNHNKSMVLLLLHYKFGRLQSVTQTNPILLE